MAFGDTITITINSIGIVLDRINQDQYSSEYQKRDNSVGCEYNLKIRHTKDKQLVNGFQQERHYVVFSQTIFPASDGSTPGFFRSIATTILADRTDTQADVQLFEVGFAAFLTSTNFGKLLNWNS